MRLLQEMQRGAPVPAWSRANSRGAPSAAAGGDIGWIASTELSPELQPIAERLQPGQVSLPVRTRNGVYIIAMRDRRAGATAGATSAVTLRQVTAPAARQSRARTRAAPHRRLRRARQRGFRRRRRAGDRSRPDHRSRSLARDPRSHLGRRRAGTRDAGRGRRRASQPLRGLRASRPAAAAFPTARKSKAACASRNSSMLAERYLRNLRREATIITRQQ